MSGKEKNPWDEIPSLDLEMDDEYAEKVKAREGRRHHRTDISTLKTVLHGEISSLPIRVATAANGVFDSLILDLSESGCRIASPKILKEGELTKVGFIINQRTVVSKAIARWISSKDYGCSAGLEFQGISKDLKEFLGTISSASLFSKVGSIK